MHFLRWIYIYDMLLSEFVQERSYIILGWERFSIQADDFIRIWTDPHIEQLHRYGSRVRLDFSGFVKSMRPHNGNSVLWCEYVAQRYVDDTALIEPSNSTQRPLTIPMYSNMILNQNSRAYAEIWRWNWPYCFNHSYGTFDMFVHRSNGFIVCDETCRYISSSHLGSI